jgi:hypothetical protein
MSTRPKIGTAATPRLTVEATLEILRGTIPRLTALTHGAPPEHLTAVTSYGWSVNDQLAHLRSCQEVLGGNMLRIVREDHPAWKATSPRRGQERYFGTAWDAAFSAFRDGRDELLATLDGLAPESWQRTATVTAPPNTVYEYSTLYYGDWLARHERSHLDHMARILEELKTP